MLIERVIYSVRPVLTFNAMAFTENYLQSYIIIKIHLLKT